MPRVFKSRQRIALGPLVAGSLFALVDGLAMVEGLLNKDRPQVVNLVFPGDVVFPKAIPPLSNPSITCLSRRNLVIKRSTESVFAPVLARLESNEVSYAAARTGLQTIILASLSGEERVATLLYEFALRSGTQNADSCTFVLLLSRAEAAVYLGLNPDTVSRIMSALKSDGIIVFEGHSTYRCPDLKRLAERTPVASTLRDLITHKVDVTELIV